MYRLISKDKLIIAYNELYKIEYLKKKSDN